MHQPWGQTVGRPLGGLKTSMTNRAVRDLDSTHEAPTHSCFLPTQDRESRLKLLRTLAGFSQLPPYRPWPMLSALPNPTCSEAQFPTRTRRLQLRRAPSCEGWSWLGPNPHGYCSSTMGHGPAPVGWRCWQLSREALAHSWLWLRLVRLLPQHLPSR